MRKKLKYKIGIGINYWDDPKGLLRILSSPIYDLIDVVYIIDGRYKGRKDEEVNPIINISLMIEEYPKIHYVKMRDKIQIDKRNRYLELAEQDDLDFLIKCDSDEYLVVDEKVFLADLKNVMDFEEVKTFPIDFINGINTKMKSIRLWKKPFTYRHRQNTGPNISHSQLYGNYGKDIKEVSRQFQKWLDIYKRNVKGITLIHDKSCRTKKRVDWDYVYYSNNPTR